MTIEVHVFSRNFEVTENLNDQIQRKVSGLDRYLDDIIEARVDLASTNARRAEERSSDIVNALNIAVDTLQRRIKRFKGKRSQRWKQGLDRIEEIADETDELDKPVIARIKKFSLRPMSEWEAIEQMELLGHNNFFVFYNAQTEAINVLYKRHDETFGLIQPEIG